MERKSSAEIKEERLERKQRFHNYRETAKRLYEDVGKVESEHIHIPDHGNLQIVEDGAFVEAIIWIPLDKLLKD